ncbi:ATP-dependent metallopeptidase FtsH/Yme1/Tma family protein [Clostridiaceae bacterium AF02-42]|jgi:cell division protease FtsH|uniref:ATP-dependent zinc metalloprotease FtsH n=1 Tax=Clostridium sp. AF28-12 TaxID=2305241 RepID=UPI000E3F3F2F|nr:ATP-dependent zinc metalloprotease FtsH [Clostridium sp. AF28-12]RGE00622.1 ATP-dependent metallopeptidase FtsH/Yme1/Tma family protein [Clostridium sp. AF28-12]RGE01187.1 ATP-dependent metallopeptidase FtsH/Yme1/Tma family protein [Clostridiaceae bacterium AF02-42]
MDNNNQNRNGGKRPSGQNIGVLALILVITLIAVTVMNNMVRKNQTQELGYEEFVEYLKEGEIDTAKISNNRIYLTPKTSSTKLSRFIQYYTVRIPDVDLAERLLDANGVHVVAEDTSTSASILNFLMGWVLPSALMIGLLYMMYSRMGGGGMMGVGKSNAKVYVQKETGVTFADVAGEDEAKESLVEIVDFLHNPQKYSKIGAKLPKGALLVGPPGTGKTLLAKAVAGEAHVPFYSLSGSDFVEMFVGVGASRVRDLFKQAQQSAPCIIFIDEIDAIGRSRDSRMGGNDEREQTLNQLLSEMDGFDSSKGLLVLGATNRPEILDPALLRPGRFDRRVIVDKPDLKGRVNILKVHSKDVRLDETVDFEEIALATSGAVGADLANMMNEAAINAVKNGRQAVSQKDLFEAVELVLVGKEKKDRILSKEERRIVSYHEVGHALVTALQKDAEPVQKITIVPRTMGALGYVMQVPEEEKYLNTKKELEAMLVVSLAGRAAEELVFDTVTTGAANDIEQATRIARAMVTQYGMSEKFGLMGLATQENQYLTGRTVLNCGDATAAEIDTEVMKMLKNAYAEAKRLLSENREAMDQIAAFLIEKETITGKEFMKIFRQVKGIPEPEEGKKEEKSRMGGEFAEDAASQPVQAAEALEAPTEQNPEQQN